MTSAKDLIETHRVTHVEDSFPLLKELPDHAFDVTITDPPYPKHVQDNMCSGSLVGTKSVPKYELGFAPLTEYTFVRDLVRVTKRWVVIFCALEDLGNFQRAAPEHYIRGCVWVKTNAMGQLTRDRPATSYEAIAILHGDSTKKRWNGKGSYGVWVCPGTRGVKDRHPNQKPLRLCQKLVALFSEREEVVFDPFAGSGSISIAAIALGRQTVAWEQDKTWVDKANLSLTAREADGDEAWALNQCAARDLW